MQKLIKFALFTQHDLTRYITRQVNVSQQVAPVSFFIMNFRFSQNKKWIYIVWLQRLS